MQPQIVICWPESQDLFVLGGFKEHCRLINGEKGIDTYGSSAYLVETDWLNSAAAIPDDYIDMGELNMVFDDELESLELL